MMCMVFGDDLICPGALEMSHGPLPNLMSVGLSPTGHLDMGPPSFIDDSPQPSHQVIGWLGFLGIWCSMIICCVSAVALAMTMRPRPHGKGPILIKRGHVPSLPLP